MYYPPYDAAEYYDEEAYDDDGEGEYGADGNGEGGEIVYEEDGSYYPTAFSPTLGIEDGLQAYPTLPYDPFQLEEAGGGEEEGEEGAGEDEEGDMEEEGEEEVEPSALEQESLYLSLSPWPALQKASGAPLAKGVGGSARGGGGFT